MRRSSTLLVITFFVLALSSTPLLGDHSSQSCTKAEQACCKDKAADCCKDAKSCDLPKKS